jgi:hypothetical protein
MKLKLLSIVVFLLAVFQVHGQQTVKITPSGTGYLEYLPDGYNSNNNKYPLIISLHGVKEKGPASTDPVTVKAAVPNVAKVGLAKYIKYGAKYPSIVISPQLKTSYGSWPGDYVIEVLNYVKTQLRVDEKRIYLTGLSLGGGGVWNTVAAYPQVFAAIAPMCGIKSVSALAKACDIASSSVPVWAFHGDKDNIVHYNVSVNHVNAINSCLNPKCNPQSKLTIYPGIGHVVWDKAYKETNVINWMLSFVNGSSTPSNQPPVANAGADRTLTLPTNSVVIKGSGSDSDGSISSYAWSQVSGPSTAVLTNKTTASLTASGLVSGSYNFQIKVTDNKGAMDTDNVTIKVNASTSSSAAPIANAGNDKVVGLPTSSTAIVGTGTDADGTIASYKWTKISGPACSMMNSNKPTVKLSGLKAGTYTFRLTVKDNKGLTHSDDVLLNVSVPPIVSAGSDRTVTLPVSSLVLNGAASDPDGTVVQYLWSKYSGPNVEVSNSSTKNLTVNKLFPGTYVFKLAVKDNVGLSSFDYVTVKVNGTSTVKVATQVNTHIASSN